MVLLSIYFESVKIKFYIFGNIPRLIDSSLATHLLNANLFLNI